jgi:type IV pilus biogenesis protein PilP
MRRAAARALGLAAALGAAGIGPAPAQVPAVSAGDAAGTAAPVVSAPPVMSPEVSPDFIDKLSRIQNNIGVLELEVREAELKARKKGFEDIASGRADLPHPGVPGGAAPASQSTPATPPPPASGAVPATDALPVVESVRGSGSRLVATLRLDGAVMPVTAGTTLPNGWRILQVDAAGVLALPPRRGAEAVRIGFATLPAEPAAVPAAGRAP